MARRPPSRSSRRRKKKSAPVGLIVGLILGGIALIGIVTAIVLVSGNNRNNDSPLADSDDSSLKQGKDLREESGRAFVSPEPEPFHNQGIFEVGPMVRQEIRLSNARFGGFAKTQTGIPFATWRVDYEFTNGGFQPATLRDAYEIRIRGSKLEQGNIPQERAWTIRHPGNEAVYSEQEADAHMRNPQGTVELTWVIPQEDFAPPYTFWVYRKEPRSDELFQRVSNYIAADGEVRPH